MFAIHSMLGKWTVMTHWSAFGGFNYQGSDRGDQQFSSPNWFMVMAMHSLAGGELGARAMVSLEPLTVGRRGYPLLLQTGESFEGAPLHDRQHPHDLVMEASVQYSRPVSGSIAFEVYLAPAGEPALGPTAVPHRLSASADPFASLGHHWQDSTHISYGVVTAGLFTRMLKVEGSWFNGREPDENRYNLDLRVPDSYSGRISLNPTEMWSLQASYGFLKSPEGLKPENSLHRVTASATYTRPIGDDGYWAATGIWGRNMETGEPGTDAFLLESNLNVDGHHNVFGRTELARKTGGDLVLTPPMDKDVFNIFSVAGGYLYDFSPVVSMTPGLGVRGSINFIGDGLTPFYGTSTPAGVMVFLRLRPARTAMKHSLSPKPEHH